MIRLVAASQVFAGHVVAMSDGAVGVVVERGESFPDALDPAPAVRVLVLEAGAGGLERGTVAQLAYGELVVDLGELRVRATVPAEWVSVANQG